MFFNVNVDWKLVLEASFQDNRLILAADSVTAFK